MQKFVITEFIKLIINCIVDFASNAFSFIELSLFHAIDAHCERRQTLKKSFMDLGPYRHLNTLLLAYIPANWLGKSDFIEILSFLAKIGSCILQICIVIFASLQFPRNQS